MNIFLQKSGNCIITLLNQKEQISLKNNAEFNNNFLR